jgi:hypothetical protein
MEIASTWPASSASYWAWLRMAAVQGAADGGREVTARELWRPVSSSSASPLESSWARLRTAAVQGPADGG